MYPIPGHLSFSLVCHRYLRGDLIAVIVGGLLPDLIDKPLNDVFQLTPHGRYAMHSLTGLVVLTALVFCFFGRRISVSYFAGHLAHLVGDIDFCPWFWPFVNYEFPHGIDTTDILHSPLRIFFPGWILTEALILGLALFLFSKYAERRWVQGLVLIAIVGLFLFRVSMERPDYAILEGGE